MAKRPRKSHEEMIAHHLNNAELHLQAVIKTQSGILARGTSDEVEFFQKSVGKVDEALEHIRDFTRLTYVSAPKLDTNPDMD